MLVSNLKEKLELMMRMKPELLRSKLKDTVPEIDERDKNSSRPQLSFKKSLKQFYNSVFEIIFCFV